MVTDSVSDDDLRAFVAAARWKDARPNPVVPPHSYTHRDWQAPYPFQRFAAEIRRRGYKGTFLKKEYTYLDLDGFTYWTMGAPLEVTIILNRRPKE